MEFSFLAEYLSPSCLMSTVCIDSAKQGPCHLAAPRETQGAQGTTRTAESELLAFCSQDQRYQRNEKIKDIGRKMVKVFTRQGNWRCCGGWEKPCTGCRGSRSSGPSEEESNQNLEVSVFQCRVSHAYPSSGDLVKMQILSQQVWGRPAVLHFPPSSQKMPVLYTQTSL